MYVTSFITLTSKAIKNVIIAYRKPVCWSFYRSYHRDRLDGQSVKCEPSLSSRVLSRPIMNFENKVVLITGASSGIGAATAVYFAGLGADLVLAARNETNLAKVGQDCEEAGKRKPLLVVTDVTKEDDNERLIKKTIEHFKKLDVLVNNAGRGCAGSIENTSLEQFDDMMTINVRSVYHLTMLAVPHLIQSKGSVVNVSSIAGTRSFPNFLAYCIAKAAIDQFTRCTALDLAPKQVRVNCVNPGVIISNFHREVGMDEEAYKAYLERSKQTHALGRVGEGHEVAAAIAFLAGETASFITGVCLPVDGGKHAMCPR
ncbi:3-oxoacyl-[acyl-carrier-protein] reductase FabG-like [Uranotaenia lowii]|uniref:3-oxoacyl-[acyl-carrier-protein] reductase FabG-like n=1 Tax=Uranotaenia lowii TaxID=190385 RepID=UPI002479F581|nr:3-oxoacyl-[acyl-carrier-protein] reductase FabG-like [Uranotaenia lowii]